MTASKTGKARPSSPTRRKRWRAVALVLVVVLLLGGYGFLLRRARVREARMERFLELDDRYECCTLGESQLPSHCRAVLEDLIDLSRGGDVSRPAPAWLPSPVRLLADQVRGADPATQQAVVLYWQCPNAQELAGRTNTSPAEQLCGVVATWEQRENLAREAARRGTLVRALTHLPCSKEGYEAGLRRIQTDFRRLCARDACLDALLHAPPSCRSRVREIVAAHPDAVLSALLPILGPDGDPRASALLSDVFGQDAGAIAALSRGDLDGLDLASALDLLELPLNPKKAFLLRQIRDRSSEEVSSVAAVFLDAAEAATATIPELRRGLLALAEHQCVLVERAAQRLDLETASRANAALPALLACPEAALSALADGERLAITRRMLEAVLSGRLGQADTILADRLDRADLVTLETFLDLAARPDLEPAALPILETLRASSAARYRLLEEAFPGGREGVPEEGIEGSPRVTRAFRPRTSSSGPVEPTMGPGPVREPESLEESPSPAPGETSPVPLTEEQLLTRELQKLGIPTPEAQEE